MHPRLPSVGAVKGMLFWTQGYGTDSGQGAQTFYAYDKLGNVELTYRLWENPTAGQADRWVVSRNVYDTAGRTIETKEGVYLRATDTAPLSLTRTGDGPLTITDTAYRAERTLSQTVYNTAGDVAHTVDEFGGVTASQKDARGNTIRTLYADGTETRTSYDALGRAEWTMDRFASTSTYDPATKTFGPPDGTATAMATRTIYDKLGRVVGTERYKDQRITIGTEVVSGQTMPMSSPPAGLIGDRISVTSAQHDAAGRVIAQVDASGLRSETVYLPDGRVKQTRAGDTPWTRYGYARVDVGGGKFIQRDTVTDARGQNTTSERDALGRVTRTTFQDGTYTQTKYGVNGQPVAGHAVPTGQTITGQQVVSVSQRRDPDPTIPSDDSIATQQFYNPAGQLTDVWQPAVDDALTTPTDLVRPRWRYTYDENGNQLTQTDPRGKVTSFAYDERGLRTSRTLPPDSDGNTANDTETWTYDLRGRVDVHTDFKGQATKNVYETDARYGGRLKEEQRFNAAPDATPDEKTVWSYDALGRGSSVTESANLDLDDLTPLQVTRTETIGYDPLTGAVILTTSPEGVVRHTYDPATGRLLGTWTAPDTTTVTDLATARTSAHTLTEFEYNYLGQLWKVKAVRMNGATVPTASQTTTHTYDSVGNLSTLALPNGVTTTYTYDALNRLDTLFARRGTTVVFSQDYELRNDGQRSAVNETREGGGTARIEWTYDALNRLTNENYNSSDNTKDYVAAFTFDLAGNRKQKTQTGAFQPATTTYTVNDRDQLTSEVTGGTTTNHTYDANGSLTVKGTESFAWDLRNRMKSATVAGVTTTYGYDSSGIRVREKAGADDVYYLTTVVNPTGYAQTIEQWKVGNPSADASYNWGRDLASQTRAGVTTYYVQDGLGSTRALTDGSGVVTDTLDYAAYGKVVTRTGATLNVYEFAGEHVDGRIGQSFNRARWYALNGRWTGEDPAEFGPGDLADANQYLYVGANSVNRTDPTGMFSVGELSVADGIRNVIAGAYLYVSAGVSAAAQGVIDGLTLNQVLIGFTLDTLLGPLDEAVSTLATLLEMLERGVNILIDRDGSAKVEGPQNAGASPGPITVGGLLLGLYNRIRRPGSIYKRHHLNQRAVFESLIPENSVAIQLTQQQHDLVHERMRAFYRPYIGTLNRPTVNEYNRAMIAALGDAGLTRQQTGTAMRWAKAEQHRAGLPGQRLIPRVPTR